MGNTPMVGRRFGRLVVIEEAKEKTKDRCRAYICKCDCGNITPPIKGSYLRSGHTQSCGCFRRERVIEATKLSNTTHGQSRTKLYGVWCSMKNRCEDPKNKDYQDYGGRGIRVCEEWHDAGAFTEWAFANGYKQGLQIDRIDVNGNYCPENCRWATAKEQSNNRRSNKAITCNGVTKNLCEWSKETGIKGPTILWRLGQGWTPEQALGFESRSQYASDILSRAEEWRESNG